MAITKIEVDNFTVFERLKIDINASVNVFIGENGTGKTHLLKFISQCINPYGSGLLNSYDAKFDCSIERLLRNQIEVGKATTTMGEEAFPYTIEPNPLEGISAVATFKFSPRDVPQYYENVVFIPAKDMLTHSPRFLSLVRERSKQMPFDETLISTISKAQLPALDEVPEIAKTILPELEKEMNGSVVFENDEFFILKKSDGRKSPFSVEAEGMKKIGLIWCLLMNGSITKDSILLWDEPEANINPKLIPLLVDIILELGRNGVQIFLATHDYFLPKYIEVSSTDADKVAFHSLYKTDNGVKCETDTKFSLLDENAIIQERINLYEAEIDKRWE